MATKMDAQLSEIFGTPEMVRPPWAPQWWLALLKIGHGFSVSGKGPSLAVATTSCLGEAAEISALLRRPEDKSFSATEVATGRHREIDAKELTMPGAEDTGPGTEGAAAGSDFDDAAKRAVNERIERHLVAAWWLGHQEPSCLPKRVTQVIDVELSEARFGGQKPRETYFVYIGQYAGIKAVLAVSSDLDGHNPIFGVAASSDLFSAASAAAAELIQMEFAFVLAEYRRKLLGDDEEGDGLLGRISVLEGPAKDLILPKRTLSDSEYSKVKGCPVDVQNLQSVWVADLTRPDIPCSVARAYAPHLLSVTRDCTGELGTPL